MTYDGVPGGFAFITDGGMAPTIGPGGTPASVPCSEETGSAGCTPVAAGAVAAVGAGAGGGGGLGSAQAAARAPTAITLNQVRVTSASPVDRARYVSQDTQAGPKLQNRVTFHVIAPGHALTFTGNDGTLFCTAYQ